MYVGCMDRIPPKIRTPFANSFETVDLAYPYILFATVAFKKINSHFRYSIPTVVQHTLLDKPSATCCLA